LSSDRQLVENKNHSRQPIILRVKIRRRNIKRFGKIPCRNGIRLVNPLLVPVDLGAGDKLVDSFRNFKILLRKPRSLSRLLEA
jgi:hypothetical protein